MLTDPDAFASDLVYKLAKEVEVDKEGRGLMGMVNDLTEATSDLHPRDSS